jgi:hypothetical protein
MNLETFPPDVLLYLLTHLGLDDILLFLSVGLHISTLS